MKRFRLASTVPVHQEHLSGEWVRYVDVRGLSDWNDGLREVLRDLRNTLKIPQGQNIVAAAREIMEELTRLRARKWVTTQYPPDFVTKLRDTLEVDDDEDPLRIAKLRMEELRTLRRRVDSMSPTLERLERLLEGLR